MIGTGKLALFVSGASRGLGKAFTLKAAKDEANVAARTIFTMPKKVEGAAIEEKQHKTSMQNTAVTKMWFSKEPVTAILGSEDSSSNSVDFAHKTSNESFKIAPLLWRSEKMTVLQKRLMSSQAGGNIEGIFTTIKEKLSADMVSSTKAIFQFNLTDGGKEETYHIDLRNGEGTAGKGKPAENPDATLTMNTENFNKMFTGKLKPTSAFMTGKLKISGNMQQALKLEKLLSSLKPKA